MNPSSFSDSAKSFPFRLSSVLLGSCAILSLLASSLYAGLMPANLGNGLDALVEANMKLAAAKRDHTESKLEMYEGFATKKAGNLSHLIIKDDGSRILVRVQPNGIVPVEILEKRAESRVPKMKIVATDRTYHGAGVFEAFVPLEDVAKIAGMKGVSAVKLSLKPIHANARLSRLAAEQRLANSASGGQPAAVTGEILNAIGTVFDFGITQHRVDQINKTYNPSATLDYEGTGMSIGDLSDSFDVNGGTITAATDVASGDLPGTGNAVNAQPVVVLQDFPAGANGTDEGRAMCQTLYKMAPKARLAFATADFGEVGFANNIRALAGLPNFTYPPDVQQGFKADVVVDDVSYLDEPFFQDGIVAQGVNDVVAAGVSYCSSAANNPGTNGYDSDFRFVNNQPAAGTTGLTAANNAALVGTNINLANVPAALYAGGFHNFNPNGLDVAQTVNIDNATALNAAYGETSPIDVILQWNDPDDTTTPSINTPAEFTDQGTITYNPTTQAGNAVSFTHALVAGQEYYLDLEPAQNPTTPGDNPLDGQITVVDPNGNEISFTDNNGSGSPETTLFFAPLTGTYTFTITAFEIPQNGEDITDGSFTLSTYTANGHEEVTQDLNLLVFDLNGNYLPANSATANSIASNSPIEIAAVLAPNSDTQVQFVISRANLPPASGRVANHLRYLCFGDGIEPLGPAEYFSYTTPLTFGHSCAAGANGVAAYPYYRPSIPEYYSSPGPATIYFDANNNPLAAPDVRLKPDVAAMDGANTTFFGGDGGQDLDSSPNFFGTSDAAPHAAAIVALVLEAAGGPGSLTPAQVKSVLQSTAFQHDLDPYYAKGTARTTDGGKVSLIVKGDDEDATAAVYGAQGTEGIQDANAITVQYVGQGSLTSLTLNPSGAIATSGNVTDGNNGLTVPSGGTSSYFDNLTPGLIFSSSAKAFTPGTSAPAALSSEATDTPSNFLTGSVTHFSTLTINFPTGDFVGGDVFRFGIGRDELASAIVENGQHVPVSNQLSANGSADIVGGGVSLPNVAVSTPAGMTFSGTTSTGATFGTTSPAVINNRIGTGYSVLDGFGFINAEAAVQAVATPPVPAGERAKINTSTR